VTATSAFSRRIIFKKFNLLAALGAIYLKNRAGLPILSVLSWAFHFLYFPYSPNEEDMLNSKELLLLITILPNITAQCLDLNQNRCKKSIL